MKLFENTIYVFVTPFYTTLSNHRAKSIIDLNKYFVISIFDILLIVPCKDISTVLLEYFHWDVDFSVSGVFKLKPLF